MNLNMIGNMNTHLKTLKMQTQWERKKASGEITETRDPSVDAWQKIVDNMHGIGEEDSTGQGKLQEIHTKLQSGGRLTQEERDYLRVKDPETYGELVQEERERKAYEQALRRCKTKEEADRLKVSQLSKAMTIVKSVENNPEIPLAKKLEITMREQRRVNNVMESTRKFVARGEYERLPTEAEQAEAGREAAEKRNPALEQEEAVKSEESVKPEAAVEAADTPARAKESQPTHAAKAPEAETVGRAVCEKPEPRIESEAARKVRRARAKAAYAARSLPDEFPLAGTPPRSILDRKA